MEFIRNILFCLCFFYLQLSSQNECKKWYFGNYAGLDFVTSPPTVLTNGAMFSAEPCGTISDNSGNLLFYTNGLTIWNKLHVPMANGTGLQSISTGQSGHIIKQPGNSNLYYVFTENGSGISLYSIIDMSLAAGMGSVTVKNATLHTMGGLGLFTSIRHSNGIDIWLLTHEYTTNNFRCYLVTSTGISATTVISSIGPVFSSSSPSGTFKFAANGRKLGVSNNSPQLAALLDFDPSTGVLSNILVLNNIFDFWMSEFSPDGTKFYAGIGGSSTIRICQWDLCAGSASAIVNSLTTFTTVDVPMGFQLGPDGKIYFSLAQNYLGVIHNPNIKGAGCNIVEVGQATSGFSQGLPTFMCSYFKQTPGAFNYTVDPLSCGNATFEVPCTSPNTYTSVLWNFNDPNSASNTASVANITHTFSAPGTYTVKLTMPALSGVDTFYQVVNVPFAIPSLSVSGSFTICKGETAKLIASGANSYSWNTGASTPSIAVSPTSTTFYNVTGTSTCSTVKSMTVNVKPCLGMEDSFLDENITRMYPNPVLKELFIETSIPSNVIITDQLGRVKYECNYLPGTHLLDINDLAKGIYFVRINSSGTIKTEKLIKPE
jgi:hypothetical protein